MGDLDCRIVAMLGLALSLLSLCGVIFVRHHHNAYHHSAEAFTTESEYDNNADYDSESTTDDEAADFTATNLNNETDTRVSEACLQCICEASTGCLPVKCSGLDCGIFRISTTYWIDAGSPVNQDQDNTDIKSAYLQCVNNPYCAARTVRRYIDKYIQDCDDDGLIDCYDYAVLHIQGPKGCKVEELSPTIFGRLYRCLNDLTVKTRRIPIEK